MSTIAEEPTPSKAVGTISEEDGGSPRRAAAKSASPRPHIALTKKELEETVTTTLTETSTFFLLDIRGTCVALDGDDAAAVLPAEAILAGRAECTYIL